MVLEFHRYLNTLVPEIEFTGEEECEITLPFLDVLIMRQASDIMEMTNDNSRSHIVQQSPKMPPEELCAHHIPPSEYAHQHNRTMEHIKTQTLRLIHCKRIPKELHQLSCLGSKKLKEKNNTKRIITLPYIQGRQRLQDVG